MVILEIIIIYNSNIPTSTNISNNNNNNHIFFLMLSSYIYTNNSLVTYLSMYETESQTKYINKMFENNPKIIKRFQLQKYVF